MIFRIRIGETAVALVLSQGSLFLYSAIFEGPDSRRSFGWMGIYICRKVCWARFSGFHKSLRPSPHLSFPFHYHFPPSSAKCIDIREGRRYLQCRAGVAGQTSG